MDNSTLLPMTTASGLMASPEDFGLLLQRLEEVEELRQKLGLTSHSTVTSPIYAGSASPASTSDTSSVNDEEASGDGGNLDKKLKELNDKVSENQQFLEELQAKLSQTTLSLETSQRLLAERNDTIAELTETLEIAEKLEAQNGPRAQEIQRKLEVVTKNFERSHMEIVTAKNEHDRLIQEQRTFVGFLRKLQESSGVSGILDLERDMPSGDELDRFHGHVEKILEIGIKYRQHVLQKRAEEDKFLSNLEEEATLNGTTPPPISISGAASLPAPLATIVISGASSSGASRVEVATSPSTSSTPTPHLTPPPTSSSSIQPSRQPKKSKVTVHPATKSTGKEMAMLGHGIATGTNDTPFVCRCGMEFRDQQKLTWHVKVRTPAPKGNQHQSKSTTSGGISKRKCVPRGGGDVPPIRQKPGNSFGGKRCRRPAAKPSAATKLKRKAGMKKLQRELMMKKDHALWSNKKDDRGVYYCTCGWSCRLKQNVQSHATKYTTGRKFVCDQCPADSDTRFVYLYDLKRHLRSVHRVVNPLKEYGVGCALCGTMFRVQTELLAHRQTEHYKAPRIGANQAVSGASGGDGESGGDDEVQIILPTPVPVMVVSMDDVEEDEMSEVDQDNGSGSGGGEGSSYDLRGGGTPRHGTCGTEKGKMESV